MADGHALNVPVLIPQNLTGGEYANSFRILPDGPDLFLDFCTFSQSDQQAVLVARIRVQVPFIEQIRDCLNSTMLEIVGTGLLETVLVKGTGLKDVS